jgi:hypothetical protein
MSVSPLHHRKVTNRLIHYIPHVMLGSNLTSSISQATGLSHREVEHSLCSGNSLDLNSAGVWFETQPEHQVS